MAGVAVFHPGTGIENLQPGRLNQFKNLVALCFGDDHHDDHGLFGLLEKAGRVNSAVATIAGVTVHDRGATDADLMSRFYEPVSDRLVLIFPVTQGVEIDLVACHEFLLGLAQQFPAEQTNDGCNDGRADMGKNGRCGPADATRLQQRNDFSRKGGKGRQATAEAGDNK